MRTAAIHKERWQYRKSRKPRKQTTTLAALARVRAVPSLGVVHETAFGWLDPLALESLPCAASAARDRSAARIPRSSHSPGDARPAARARPAKSLPRAL